MTDDSTQLSRAEFQAWASALRDDCREIKEHLAELNGRTRVTETKIAVLEDRGTAGKDVIARWGAGIGAALAGLAGALWK